MRGVVVGRVARALRRSRVVCLQVGSTAVYLGVGAVAARPGRDRHTRRRTAEGASPPLRWSNPDRAPIVRRAVRVTIAACARVLSVRVRGGSAGDRSVRPVRAGGARDAVTDPRVRAAAGRVMLRALPVGLVLVALGTMLAVHTWAAVVGMLAVGFVLAFAAVAGPRPAGAAPGLQLFYILACLPALRAGSSRVAAGRPHPGRAAARRLRALPAARADDRFLPGEPRGRRRDRGPCRRRGGQGPAC